MKIKSLLFLLLLGLLFSPAAFSQDEGEESTFTISGSVDSYFHTSLDTEEDAPFTSFANLPGFALGMVNIIASYEGEKAGFVGDVVFGPRGVDAVFQPSYTGQKIVNQLYAYLKIGDMVKLNLGQFNTFLGYEVISPTVNVNYSTSYMFTNGPFNHTGLRADIDLESGLGFKLAIMNPTDFVEFNGVDSYTLGAQVGYSGDQGGVWLNVLSGDQDGDGPEESTFQIDLTAGWDLTESFYLGLNTTQKKIGDDGFMGFALYPKYALSESFTLGFRGEYFKILAADEADENDVIALTLSGNYSVGNLTIIPEFRMDKFSEKILHEKDEDIDVDVPSKDSMLTFNLAAVYKF